MCVCVCVTKHRQLSNWASLWSRNVNLDDIAGARQERSSIWDDTGLSFDLSLCDH